MESNELDFMVFYDGDCGFCNSVVQFILKHEKHDKMLFSALQSDFANDFLKRHHLPLPDYSTLYVWSNRKLLKKSSAALEISSHLNMPWSWLKIFKFTPLFLRDKVYDLIAGNRKKIKKEACYLPSPEQRKRSM